jgi:hypothetical protein
MTCAEAVAYLRARGFHAVERDWTMGQTIGVVTGPINTDVGITVYRRAVYIAPRGDGWVVEEITVGPPDVSEPAVTSLEDACVRAGNILPTARGADVGHQNES